MTNANTKGWINVAFIIIDYDTLSEKNKEVANNLLLLYPENCKKDHFSIEGNNIEIQITMPIDGHTTFKEINDFYFDKFKDFEMQEIFSIYDCETGNKNIYSIEDVLVVYLMHYSNEFFRHLYNRNLYKNLKEEDNLDETSEEILFLQQLGGKINRLKFETNFRSYRYGYYNGSCFDLKQTLKQHKEKLFLNENYDLKEVNKNVLEDFLHTYVSKDFFFNEEDQRFYLNQELLDKHNKFLSTKKIKVNQKKKSFS